MRLFKKRNVFSVLKHVRKNRKAVFIFSGVSIFIFGTIALLLALYARNSRAAWYDSNYGYRQTITITNNGSSLTNHVVEVAVDTKTLIDATKLQSDCDDIRFTSSDGSTLIDHFTDYCSNTTVAGGGANARSIFFVEVPSIAASGTTTIYMYYSYASATSASSYSNIGSTRPTGIQVGTGKDGPITISADTNINTADSISSRTCTDAGISYDGDAPIYTSTDNVANTDSDITLASSPDSSCLAAGDEVLVFNAQGNSSSNGDGLYEFMRIQSISTSTLTFTHDFTNAYNASAGARKLIVQRVPNYTSVTISNSGTNFTPSAWDGTQGGVMAFRANGTVTVNSGTTIDANGLGYRGGAGGASASNPNGGTRGESYDGTSSARGGSGSSNGQTQGGGKSGDGGTTSPADGGTATGAGGGGGSDGSANGAGVGSGAAGGGGGYAGGGGGGAGGYDGNATTGRDGGAGASSAGTQAGGGGGGCADGNNNSGGDGGNAGSAGSASSGCGSGDGAGGAAGTSGNQASGGGGSASGGSGGGGGGGGFYGAAALTTLYFGSGGGGGGGGDEASSGSGAAGGAGGGIIYIGANSVSNSGVISSNGEIGTTASAAGGGSGGGGAGGSVFITTVTDSLGSSLVTAAGGSGGSSGTDIPGAGSGSIGRVHVKYTDSDAPTTSPTANTSQVAYASEPTNEESEADANPIDDVYWPMSEGYGTTVNDVNTAAVDGTRTNALWKSEELCVSDNCLFFDGTGDYVSASSASSLNMGTGESVTIQAWFRHPDISTNPDYLVAKHDGTEAGYKIYMNADGTVTCAIDSDSTFSPTDSTSSTAALDDNKWHHLACVKATTTSLKLYIDGVAVGTEDTSIAANVANNDTFYLGIDGNGSSNGWEGFIDEFKIYRSARTADQIKADFASRGGSNGTSAQFGPDNKYLSDGLTGYWKMDEAVLNSCTGGSNDICDSSGNGKDGAFEGTMTASNYAVGKFGRAMDLNGSSHYAQVSSPGLPTTDFTYTMWVHLDAATDEMLFMGPNSGSTNEVALHIDSNGKLQGYIDNSGITVSTTSITTSTWTHVVFTRQGGSLAYYINGVKDTASISDNATVLDFTSCPFLIGTDSDSGGCTPGSLGNYTDGRIDDFRIYNRGLSASEISRIYAWGPGPAAHWKLDENTGTTANDSSGNNNASTTWTGNTTYASGKYGSGGYFDGTDDVIRIAPATTALLDLGAAEDSYTISAWIKTSAAVVSTSDIVAKEVIGGIYPFRLYMNTSEVACFQTSDGTTTNSICGTTALNDGNWHYLTGIRDVGSDSVYLFVDGIQVETTTDLTTDPTNNNDDVSIGNGGTTYTARDFNGIIDDVKIYFYRRSNSQIIQDMNAGHPVVGSPVGSPVSYWKFDEASGTNANDSTPSDNDLTLSSASWTNDGKYNNAWNGTGSVWLADGADDNDFDFVASDDFSISMWFKSDSSTNPSSETQYLLGKATITNTGTAGYAIYANTSGNIVFGVKDDAAWGASSPTTPAPDDTATSTADIYDGNWHHIAATKTGTSRIDLYVDGKLNASDTSIAATATLANAIALRVGDDDADSTNSFAGDIDEVKIYRYALTESDVKVDYNRNSSQVLGSSGTDSSGNATTSSTREYCIPGDSSTCNAPVGDWKLDENTDTTANDRSGNGNTGTLTLGPTWRPGKIGSSVNFDGTDDYITAGNGSSLQITGAITVSAWVNFTSTGTGKNAVCKHGNTSNRSYCLFVNGSSRAAFEVSADGVDANMVLTTGATTLSTNTWYYITAVYIPSTSVTIYVNGVQDAQNTTSIPASLFNPSSNLVIGSQNTNANFFVGRIDEVRIYNYARTPAQVMWDYNRGNPVGWWKFDECSGGTANDASGRGSNGTLTGTGSTNTSNGSCSTVSTSTKWYNGRNGKFNSSLHFDGGDDYVSIPNESYYDFGSTSPMSVAVWVKVSTFDIAWQTIISKGSDAWRLSRNSTSDTVHFGINGSASVNSTSSINDGQWHFIVGTFDGTNGRIYVDGKLEDTSAPTSLGTNNVQVAIGENLTDTGRYFEGLIDDVRIYNYALTQKQINTLMNANSAIRFAPLTGTP